MWASLFPVLLSRWSLSWWKASMFTQLLKSETWESFLIPLANNLSAGPVNSTSKIHLFSLCLYFLSPSWQHHPLCEYWTIVMASQLLFCLSQPPKGHQSHRLKMWIRCIMLQLKTLQWFSISPIVNTKGLIMAYKALYGLASAFLSPCPHHNLSSISTSLQTIPRTCQMPSSFMPWELVLLIPSSWNTLPLAFHVSGSLAEMSPPQVAFPVLLLLLQ